MTALERTMFRAGTLWAKTLDTTARALQSGALEPISTTSEFVVDHGVEFLVRAVSALERKASAKRATPPGAPRPNPFLPYDQAMKVADISPSHVCLLNKFNVIEHHLLIVTRQFEPQQRLLGPLDFEALWRCLVEIDGLAFYNGGEAAGASEPHKHLQLISLPMAPRGPRVPIEPLLDACLAESRLSAAPGLPFLHRVARLEASVGDSPADAARRCHRDYRALLAQVGLNPADDPEAATQTGPYNLLLTRRWMLVVPRSKEFFQSISVNALGFAGALLAKNERDMAAIRSAGPMRVLAATARPPA